MRENTPVASPITEIWYKQIRSARNILPSMMETLGASFNEESLDKKFTEMRATAASMSLITETINDMNAEVVLPSRHILKLNSKALLTPHDVFG